MKVETVKVKADNEQGFKIINKDDFDPKVDTLYEEKKTRAKK